jgi:hypothetical protein
MATHPNSGPTRHRSQRGSSQTPARRRMSTQVKVALIGAGAVIAAAAITAIATLSSGGHSTASPPTAQTTPPGSSATPSGKLYAEETYNRRGTDVFSDPMGDAVTSGPGAIPFETHVMVKCWARNESGMGSINAFYLVETSPWAGEYAPANTFLNADTTGSLDPDVPQCTA